MRKKKTGARITQTERGTIEYVILNNIEVHPLYDEISPILDEDLKTFNCLSIEDIWVLLKDNPIVLIKDRNKHCLVGGRFSYYAAREILKVEAGVNATILEKADIDTQRRHVIVDCFLRHLIERTAYDENKLLLTFEKLRKEDKNCLNVSKSEINKYLRIGRTNASKKMKTLNAYDDSREAIAYLRRLTKHKGGDDSSTPTKKRTPKEPAEEKKQGKKVEKVLAVEKKKRKKKKEAPAEEQPRQENLFSGST